MSRCATPVFAAMMALALLACTGGGRQTARQPVTSQTGPARMIGLYEYMADAGLFTDCATGRRVPVAMEAGSVALERAYLGARGEPGERMLVTVMGHLAERPPMEGEGMREFLIVTRFEQVWPSESCEKSKVATPLENTTWRLVDLHGARVETHRDQPREVHIRLQPAEKRMTGFAGCNDMTGSYELAGDRLAFGLLAMTRMACPYLDEEVAFTTALGDVRRYLVLGESLVLSGEAADVARFKALYVE